MKFCTVLLFAVSATAGVLDLSFQKRRVTHDPEAATIETPRALELAIKVRNANKKGSNDSNIGAAANGTSVENSASNSTSIIDTRAAANSTSSSLRARGSAAAAGSNSTSVDSKASAGNATSLLG